jgi:hypothetical protein
VVAQRIRAITRDAPGFWQSVKESFGMARASAAAFIGSVDGNAFLLRSDIRYRNSFLPRIKGLVEPSAGGSRIVVTMNLHPIVGVFALIWFGGVGVGAFAVLANGNIGAGPTLIPFGMLVFGVALTLGGFYPEAFKARRILEQSIGAAAA